MIAAEHVARSAPDGYTLLWNITTHVQAPVVLRRFPYDPIRDFSFVARVGSGADRLHGRPCRAGAGERRCKEFIDWGRGRPLFLGQFRLGQHVPRLWRGLLAREAGLDATQVAYRGEAPMLQDNLGGQFHGGFHSTAVTNDMITTGRASGRSPPADRCATPSLAGIASRPSWELGFSQRFGLSSASPG